MKSYELTVGVLAVNNTDEQIMWLLDMAGVPGEPYRRGGDYDVIWMLNIVPEISFIKHHTDMKIVAVCMEPARNRPLNYSPDLLQLTDMYMGYRNFAGSDYLGSYREYLFPVYPAMKIEKEFDNNIKTERKIDFCMFAAHDPNIRSSIARALENENAVLGGKLFNKYVKDKLGIQKTCRYEFITENDITDYYFSEKIGESLFAGCVPIYFGSLTIEKHIPKSMYINLHQFVAHGLEKGLDNVIKYCKQDSTYERFSSEVFSNGKNILKKYTHENTIINPLKEYIAQLKDEGFQSKYRSAIYRRSRQVAQMKKAFNTLSGFGQNLFLGKYTN